MAKFKLIILIGPTFSVYQNGEKVHKIGHRRRLHMPSCPTHDLHMPSCPTHARGEELELLGHVPGSSVGRSLAWPVAHMRGLVEPKRLMGQKLRLLARLSSGRTMSHVRSGQNLGHTMGSDPSLWLKPGKLDVDPFRLVHIVSTDLLRLQSN